MHLKLSELQRVVKKTVEEEKKYLSLKNELFRVLGPPVVVNGDRELVANAVNEQLDFLESTGRSIPREDFKLSVLLESVSISSPSLRKIVARLLPQKHVVKLLEDKTSSVRCAAAKRLPYSMIQETVRRFSKDDQLQTIAREKKLQEAGISKPKVEDEEFDLYGKKPMGDSAKTFAGPDLSDAWYERLANKLCKEYGTNLEGNWEEILATRFASSYYATSGIKLDRDKLLKAIYSCLKDREDKVIGEVSLKNIAYKLKETAVKEETVVFNVVEENNDSVSELLSKNLSSKAFLEAADKIFDIKKSIVPPGIKKYRLGESRIDTYIPVVGTLPIGVTFGQNVENAFDTYVSYWNKKQELSGEPYRLSWSPHPAQTNKVGFNVTLK